MVFFGTDKRLRISAIAIIEEKQTNTYLGREVKVPVKVGVRNAVIDSPDD